MNKWKLYQQLDKLTVAPEQQRCRLKKNHKSNYMNCILFTSVQKTQNRIAPKTERHEQQIFKPTTIVSTRVPYWNTLKAVHYFR